METGNVELRGITIVAPIRSTLQGIDERRNILRGVTVAVNTDVSVMSLRVVDRNNQPIQGATCRVLNTPPPFVLSFDGIDDFGETPAFASVGNVWTAEAWVFPTKNHRALNVNAVFIGSVFDGSRVPLMIGYSHQLGAANVCVAFFDGTWRICPASTDLILNTWTHVAGVRNGTVLQIYLNGVLSHSISTSSTALTSLNLVRIGRRWDGGVASSSVFGGRIAEARVWGRAKTGAEINNEMNIRLAGNENGLLGYWPLEDGNGVVARDVVAARNATITGATWGQVTNLPIGPPIINYTTTFSSGTTNTEGFTFLNYQLNRLYGLEVTLPGRRRFIMPIRQDERQILNWQVMLSDIIATFITSEGDVLINAEPENNDSNFLIS